MNDSEVFRPALTIDRSSPIPLYHQIAKPLEQMILSGELPPGTPIEDELSLARRLKISRPTARRALQNLVELGLLSRRRGVGTSVAPKRVHRPIELTSLNDDLASSGRNPSTTVLEYSIKPATQDVAQHLETTARHPALILRRLRFADGEPLAIMTNYIKAENAPSREDLEQHGLYDCLKRTANPICTATQTISGRRAYAREARLLEESRGAALLTMQRTSYDDFGEVIEYGFHLYRASIYSFEMKLFSR